MLVSKTKVGLITSENGIHFLRADDDHLPRTVFETAVNWADINRKLLMLQFQNCLIIVRPDTPIESIHVVYWQATANKPTPVKTPAE